MLREEKGKTNISVFYSKKASFGILEKDGKVRYSTKSFCVTIHTLLSFNDDNILFNLPF